MLQNRKGLLLKCSPLDYPDSAWPFRDQNTTVGGKVHRPGHVQVFGHCFCRDLIRYFSDYNADGLEIARAAQNCGAGEFSGALARCPVIGSELGPIPSGVTMVIVMLDGADWVPVVVEMEFAGPVAVLQARDRAMTNNNPGQRILRWHCSASTTDRHVGDAAHQINPMTGGGIASGMKGGQIAGQVATKALSINTFSKKVLSEYPKRMFKEFGNTHNRFYRIKEAIHQLSDDDLNYIAEKAYNIPDHKRSLAGIFKHAVYKKPSLIVDVLKVFAGD